MSNLARMRGTVLGIIFVIAILYLSLFLALGLLVSSRRAAKCSESRDTFVDMGYFCRFYAEYTRLYCQRIFNTHGLMMNSRERRKQLYIQLSDEYVTRLQNAREDPAKRIALGGEYVTKDAAARERLSQEFLDQQHAQIQLGTFRHPHLTGCDCAVSS